MATLRILEVVFGRFNFRFTVYVLKEQDLLKNKMILQYYLLLTDMRDQ